MSTYLAHWSLDETAPTRSYDLTIGTSKTPGEHLACATVYRLQGSLHWRWILHEDQWPWWDGETEGAADTRDGAMQLAEGAVRRRFEAALAALDHAVVETAEGRDR